MPYCWDGLGNATRIQDTGYGAKLPRYTWTDEELAGTIERLIRDKAMARRLGRVSQSMQAAKGADKAARIIARIAERGVSGNIQGYGAVGEQVRGIGASRGCP